MAPPEAGWFRVHRPSTPVILFLLCLVLIIALACANIILFTHLPPPPEPVSGPLGASYRMLDLGAEANVPTWVAISLWFTAAVVAGFYSFVAPSRWSWRLLALACLVLAADEAAQLHEQLNHLGGLPGTNGVAHLLVYPWLLPGAFLALLVAAGFLRTVLSLPRPQRLLILVAGLLFVGGALGAESLGGLVLQNSGLGLRYVVITAAEEALEMTAVALFACTLMSLMTVSSNVGGLTVSVRPPVGTATS
jgi:hypothetical protein